MASSFQNVVGTPRDAVPDISKTNYLQTSPDMTEPVNEDSKERIKDTKEFFAQMIELEELAAGKMDKRLAALSNLAGSVGDIRKQMLAKEADGLTRKMLKPERLDFQKQATTVIEKLKDSTAYQEAKALGEIDRDTQLELAEKLGLQIGFIPDEVLDGKHDEHMAFYNAAGRPLVINDYLDKIGANNATSQDEWVDDYRRRTLSSVYRTVVFNWIASGGDGNDPRLERKLFDKVYPTYNKQLETAQKRFVYTLEETQKTERERVIDERITDAVLKSKSSFYGTEGVVAQVKAEYNYTSAQAQDYVYGRVGELVNKNVLTPDEGLRIIDELPFTPTDQPDKTFKNVDEYLDSIKNKDSVFYAKASGRVQTLKKIINDKKSNLHQEAVTTSTIKAREYERDEIEPLKQSSFDGTLQTSQIRSLYEEFVGADWYIEGETPIPKDLESMHNKTHTGGVRDKKVLTVGNFASEINDALEKVDLFYREQKTLDAKIDLGLTDTLAVERLQAEFKRLLYGRNGEDLATLEMSIGSGQYTFEQRRQEIFDDMEKRLDQIIKAPAIVRMDDAAGNLLKLREQVSKNNDLIYSKTALTGEDVNRLFDYLDTGGERNKELGMFYKNLRFRVIEDGQVKVLRGYEGAEVRGRALGIYDQKGKKLMNFNAKILKNYHAVNDVGNKTTAQKVLRIFSDDEQEDMREFLNQHAINRSGGTSQVEDTTFTFVRGGGTITSERQGLTRLKGSQLINLAKGGSTDFGRYKLTSGQILELADKGKIDLNKEFTEDLQSMAVIDLMSINANRTNSISGAVTSETQNFRKLTNFTNEENELIKQVFPNLKNNYFAQFKNLEAEVAKVILSDLERYQQNLDKLLEEDKARDEAEKLRRSKLSKRELRSR